MDDEQRSTVAPAANAQPAADIRAAVPAPIPAPTQPDPSSQPGSAARKFRQELEQALKDITTLKIVTVVGDVVVTGRDLDTDVSISPGAQAEAASTVIGLLDGHITNTFSSGFAALSGGGMQAFHQAQVENSHAILAGNLAELEKLATALLSLRR